MTFEEWWDRPEGCGSTPDTYKGWEQSCHFAWNAGAASRDAEVAELREQVKMLRDATKKARNGILFYHDPEQVRIGIDAANEALAATEPKA